MEYMEITRHAKDSYEIGGRYIYERTCPKSR